MDFPENVNSLFEDGVLNKDDMDVLNGLRYKAAAALCVSEEEFKKCAVENTDVTDDNTFCSVVRYLDRCMESEVVEKTAGKASSLQTALSVLGIGALAAIPAQKAMENFQRNKDIQQSWKMMIQKNPDIAENPHTPKNWSILEDFAPNIASNTHAAKAMIDTMNEYGTVSPQMIGNLISMQKGLSESGGLSGITGLQDPIKSISTVSGLLPGGDH